MAQKPDAIRVVDKLNQKPILRHLKSIDWGNTSEAPYIVEFDPTTQCNLACPDCISGALLNQDEFSNDRVIALTREMIAAGVKGVILIGGGEPMAHPRIGQVIQLLGENNVAIGITTNGLYLKKHMDVVARFANWVRVSVDAGSGRTFQRIRPSKVGDSLFDDVISNMAAYARVKPKDRILGYSFMVYSDGNYGFKGVRVKNVKAAEKIAQCRQDVVTNVGEIYQAAKIAKDIGCDYIEIKPMYDVNHFSVLQTQLIADIVEEQLDKAKALESEDFQVIEAIKLRASLRGESNFEPKPYDRCAVAQLRTLITPSGVYVCPYFRGVEQKKIGEVMNASLLEMWKGERRKEIMQRLDPSKDCPMHCIRHDSNLHIEHLIKNGFEVVEEDVRDDYDPFI